MVGLGPLNPPRTTAPPLFVYGTLLSAEVRKRVLGRPVRVARARLAGYRRLKLAGRDYPGLVRAPRGGVEGRLIVGLGPADLRRIDRYEGGEYRRRLLPVATSTGTRRAWVYVPRPGVPLSDAAWFPPST